MALCVRGDARTLAAYLSNLRQSVQQLPWVALPVELPQLWQNRFRHELELTFSSPRPCDCTSQIRSSFLWQLLKVRASWRFVQEKALVSIRP